MIQIRQNIFETNSSSVHALVIPNNQSIHIPNRVSLSGGEYGWENDVDGDTLDYFYQACLDRGREEVDKFFNYLKRKGVEEINAPEIHWVKSEWNGREYEYADNNDGYIDHASDVPLEDLFANETLLDMFLFGDSSYIRTGNDNSDMDWCDELESTEDAKVLWKYN